MTTQKNKPIDTIRDGSLKATIWKNFGEKGNFHSVDFSRTYKQGEAFKDSRSFSGSELLRIARLANIAYDEIAELRQKDVPADAEQQVTPSDGRVA